MENKAGEGEEGTSEGDRKSEMGLTIEETRTKGGGKKKNERRGWWWPRVGNKTRGKE